MTRKLADKLEEGGLNINYDKTEYMVVGGTGEDLHINDKIIRRVEHFKYLGSVIDQSGTSEKDIRNRINQASKAIKSLNGFLWSRDLTRKTKLNIVKTIVESILTYGGESWTVSEKLRKKLLATEMDGLRRGMRVSRMQHIRNEYIRQEMDAEETVVDRLEAKTLKWYGHVRRMTEERLPVNVLNWIDPGRRKRGRARLTWMEGVNKAMLRRGLDVGQWQDRTSWRIGTGT